MGWRDSGFSYDPACVENPFMLLFVFLPGLIGYANLPYLYLADDVVQEYSDHDTDS